MAQAASQNCKSTQVFKTVSTSSIAIIILMLKTLSTKNVPIDNSEGINSGQACQQDQTLLAQGTYAASNNAPVQK